jgi:hypothetical protein
VWGIWGGEEISRQGRPWYKGTVVTENWKDVEPRPEQFAWGKLDAKVRKAADHGLFVMLLVYHGSVCPEWIYEQGVPKVVTDTPERNRRIHPFYLDPAYKPLLSRLIRATAQHIAAYPPEWRGRIVGIQCPTGKSGDPQAYNGEPLEKKYRIDPHGQPWIDWTLGMFPVYQAAYADFNPPVFLMFKGPNPEANDWLLKNIPTSWRKPHSIAQGYQFNLELDTMRELYPLTRRYENGVVIRTRGELDNTTDRGKNWFNAAPIWNVYWSGLWNLTYGIDIWNQLAPVLEDARFAPALEFVGRYAGYKSAAESPGAWIALRDGLDCADTTRFPEDHFGPLGTQKPERPSPNKDRYQKIADAYRACGAALDDPENVAATGLNTRRQVRGLNDVGYQIWPDNYAMFLTQYDPSGTSRGHWRVGAKEQPYGRFARGFDHAAGKDAMYFRLDDDFFAAGPLAGKSDVLVRVVYFDQGTGQWELAYDAVDDPQKRALTVRKTNSGLWKEISVTIKDGCFSHRGPHQADLMLVNPDAEDDIFHMIELRRL